MINFPIWIPYYDFYSPALLDLFFTSDASIFSTMVFFSLKNSDHVVVTMSIDFPSYGILWFIGLLMTIFVLIGTIFVIIWETVHRRISLNSSDAAVSESSEWFHVEIDVYVPNRKYQVKPHSSARFFAACAAAIVHRNHFPHLYQKDKSSESKWKFRQASNR